jgi:C4-dicarboxylate-specific signal transduction histidine kinase
MDELNIVKGIIDLGTAGLLLYFLFIVWKDRQNIVKEKDERIKELSDSVLQIVRDNTKVQEELKSTIKENTKATETLTNYIYEALEK